MRVHFVYSKNTENAGDLSCGYYTYFAELFKKYQIVIWDIGKIDISKIAKNDVVIVGGGGLLNNSDLWNYNINRLAKKSRYCFLFGVGFNAHTDSKITIPLKLKNFREWAIRDYQHPSQGRYVPCASCLMSGLDKKYEIRRKYGVVQHFQHNLSRKFDFPLIMNNAPLMDILEFIGSSEVIITNTYHAVYWATLMQKKVILDAPFSEKFNYFKYKPVLFSGNLEKDVANAVVYTNILPEARKLVEDFIADILVEIPTMFLFEWRKRLIKIICLFVPIRKWRKLLRLRFL